jgi:hypothetical protein
MASRRPINYLEKSHRALSHATSAFAFALPQFLPDIFDYSLAFHHLTPFDPFQSQVNFRTQFRQAMLIFFLRLHQL